MDGNQQYGKSMSLRAASGTAFVFQISQVQGLAATRRKWVGKKSGLLGFAFDAFFAGTIYHDAADSPPRFSVFNLHEDSVAGLVFTGQQLWKFCRVVRTDFENFCFGQEVVIFNRVNRNVDRVVFRRGI